MSYTGTYENLHSKLQTFCTLGKESGLLSYHTLQICQKYDTVTKLKEIECIQS